MLGNLMVNTSLETVTPSSKLFYDLVIYYIKETKNSD